MMALIITVNHLTESAHQRIHHKHCSWNNIPSLSTHVSWKAPETKVGNKSWRISCSVFLHKHADTFDQFWRDSPCWIDIWNAWKDPYESVRESAAFWVAGPGTSYSLLPGLLFEPLHFIENIVCFEIIQQKEGEKVSQPQKFEV